MNYVAMGLVGLVAALHVGFLVLEGVLWNKPLGHKLLRMKPEQAEATAVLAMNQGLYNGFLAAGLAWGLVAEPAIGGQLQLFFLGCVVVAGLFGAATASRMIFFLQALPAMLALGAVLAARP